MKKRIISMLLTVLMVMSLFSGLTVSADAATYNGANTIDYTMAQGDFVLRICQKLGLNYYTCKPAIMALNNIQDGQWNKLTVGRTLTLPASDYDALLISNGAGTTVYNSGAAATTATTSTVTGTATTGTAAAVNPTTAAASADTLAYYLVPYTMSYGETVSGVCNALGVNFAIFSPFIKQVNNVSNWTRVRAGDTLIIPTPVAPAVGTTCYGVMQHMVASSDTAYGITASKGVNYSANERLLKVLNQTENLAAIKAGDKFFYPVPLTVSVPGTGNPGSTATTTTTTTVTDGNGTTTTSTTTTSKLYKLTNGLSASDGTMLFYVNNKPVTAASAGTKVTVVTETNAGKAIQSLTVKHADGKADLHLSGDTFVMPSCDVRVEASVKNGHDINISANYSGKAVASVGGISVQSAVKGATVIIKSTDPNYEITAVYASYKKLISASTKTPITVSSSKAFIMPDADADVEVVLRPVSTYSFYVNDPPFGTFYLQVNGSPVTRAAKGAEVTIVANPEEGFVPGIVTVTKHNDATKFVNFFNNTFTMPGYDVDVNVTFVAKGNNVIIMPAQGGSASAYASTGGLVSPSGVDTSETIEEAGSGEFVLLDATPEDAAVYQLNPNDPYEIVRTSDGLKVNVSGPVTFGGKNYYYFRMPKGGVSVTPHFSGNTTSNIVSMIYRNGASVGAQYQDCSFSVTASGNRAEFTTSGQLANNARLLNRLVANGENIDLRYDCADGIAFVRYSIQLGTIAADGTFTASTAAADLQRAEELTNEANNYGYFEMPDTAICISAYFESGKVPIGPAAIIEGNGTVSYMVRPAFDMPMDFSDIPGAIMAALGTSVNSAEPGETVYVLAAPANGYTFDNTRFNDKLKVTRRDNGAPLTLTAVGPLVDTRTGGIWAYQYSFTMPAVGVDVTCAFDAKPFRLYMKCVDETGKDISGLGLWQIAVNMEPGIVDNSMFAEAIGTVVEVAYGDYVTVAMTEAGWSKYDMVSFRIDSKEYTADTLNHFYNFQMIDERAKDLEIVAVMRPRVPYSVGIHNLYATYVDTTKGAAQFVILDSPTGYSDEYRTNRFNVPNYVNKAVSGDKVGVMVSSINDTYRVEAKDITLYTLGTDADRIILKEEWVDIAGNPVDAGTAGAYRVFTFTMPDSDVYISVNFSGTKNALSVIVRDAKNTNTPVKNAVQVITNTANNPITYDVGSDWSFDDVPYKTQVSIMRSTQALAESKVITKVDVTDASGKSVPYTSLTAAGEGISFTMPNEPVWVRVFVGEQDYNLPLNLVNQVTNGSFVFRKTANPSDPTYSIDNFDTGDVVYVHTTPNAGFAQLTAGELQILSNGVTNIATYRGDGIWSFTMPSAGTLVFKGDFQLGEAAERQIKLNITGATEAKIKVNFGDSTATFSNGAILTAKEGQSMILEPDTGFTISMITTDSNKGLNNNVYTVPSGLTPVGDIWDTVNITANKAAENVNVSIWTERNVYIAASAVSGIYTPADGEKTFTLGIGSVINVASATDGYNAAYVRAEVGGEVVFEQSGATVSYTIPAQDVKLYMTTTSSNAPLTLSLLSDKSRGTIGVSHQNDPKILEQESTFKRGDPLYVFAAPVTGYEIDKESFAIVENISQVEHRVSDSKATESNKLKKDVTFDAANNSFTISGFTIPDGGVTVKAEFVPKTVKVNFTMVNSKGDAQISNGRVTTTIRDSVNGVDAKFGDTVTITPVNFKWGTNGVTVDKIKTVNGNRETAARSFVINVEGTITVTLDIGAAINSGTGTGTGNGNGIIINSSSTETSNASAPDAEETDPEDVNIEYPQINDATDINDEADNTEDTEVEDTGAADTEVEDTGAADTEIENTELSGSESEADNSSGEEA